MKLIKLLVGDIMNYLTVLGRTLLFYIVITIIYRMMGKREVGELSIMDFIVSIFIAELAAISIDNYKESMLLSFLPIIALVIIQITVSKISLKSSQIRSTIEGDPSVIINRGQINFEEMMLQRYNLDDLLVQLRSKGVKSIEEVDYAILETSGRLSIFKREDDKNRLYPLPVVIDGKLQEDVLRQIGKDKVWLLEALRKENYQLEDVFYGFYQKKKLFLIRKETVK